MPPASGAGKLDALLVPSDVRRGVEEFIQQVLAAYGDNLLSIVAFGSAVTGEYDAGESDVNLLVIHASIDIEDLERVGDLSRRWLRRQSLAPRFLSKRNFDDYIRHFQVDALAMRGASAVLWGQDLLADPPVRLDALRWQAAYEIKTMRLRIKQQFWRVADDEGALRRVLVQRFTSLAHLMRAALVLQGLPGPVRRADVVESAVAHLGVDRELVDAVAAMRQRRSSPDRAVLVKLFGRLLEAIRVVDGAIGEPGR